MLRMTKAILDDIFFFWPQPYQLSNFYGTKISQATWISYKNHVIYSIKILNNFHIYNKNAHWNFQRSQFVIGKRYER